MARADRPLTLEAKRHIDEVCVAFEAAWKEAGGPDVERPRIAPYLAGVEEPERSELLRELLLLELDYRYRRGESPSAEDYRRSLPDDTRVIDEAFRKVEGLIEAFDGTESSLEPNAPFVEPILDLAPTVDRSVTEGPGRVIGPYKLLQQIGEGGMGVVYMAEQTEPVQRRVALKIIKPGMDSRQVIARFEAERHALAIMDHPNIARVLDAGATETGRPYFVMELVKGVPITRYCDEYHLTPQQRLELFVPVCHAVQHAHQKGIIHRDIKPTNVLVAEFDDRPVPKIIDFGVAKAIGQRLTEQTLFTQLGQVVGTFEYMSPEQAKLNQLDVDTRSDIYSLGVLLYELLTGETPFDRKRLRSAALDELLRIIREEEPPKPSHRLSSSESLPSIAANRHIEPKKLSTLVRGELDWIVMKALEKERSRRYETANALAADVQHYLDDEPVVACPPSAAYRFRKFARRNKALLTTVGLVLAALVLGVALSTWQAIRATRAERLATQERDRATSAEQRAVADRNRATSAEQRAISDRNQAVKSEKHAQAQRDENRRLLYVSDMAVALSAWGEVGGAAKVSELLERHRPGSGDDDLRGFEWYYLWRLVQRSRLVPTLSHPRMLSQPVYLPDGKTLATASGQQDLTTGDRVLRFWDVDSRQLKREIPVDYDNFRFSFSPDGRILASWGADRTRTNDVLKVWDVATGGLLWEEHGLVRLFDAVFTPDGQRLAFICSNSVTFWDVAARKRLDVAHDLAVAGDPDRDGWMQLAFSPDGRRLAIITWLGNVVLWDLDSRRPRRFEGKGVQGVCLAFSPDGKTIACGHDDGRVWLWDVATGSVRAVLTGHNNRVFDVAFSPDGRILASASTSIKLWDTATGRPAGEILATGVGGVAFSPDGKVLAICDFGTVRLCELATVAEKSVLTKHEARVWTLAFTPDSCTLASGGNDAIKLWDVFSGDPVTTCCAATASVAFSRDGSVLVSGGSDGTVTLWDSASGQQRMCLRDPSDHQTIWSVAISPDNTLVASGNEIGTVRVWDVKSGTLKAVLGEQFKAHVFSLAFSPDGETLAFSAGGKVSLWNVRTSDSMDIPDAGVFNVGNHLRFSPDGKTLAWGGVDGVRLYNREGRRFLDPLQGHLGPVTGVAFAPQGNTLFSAGVDRTIRIWNWQTREQRAALTSAGSYITALAVSPDGNVLASANADNSIQLWRIAKEEAPEELVAFLKLEQRIRTIASATADERRRTVADLRGRLETPGTHALAQYFPAARSLLIGLEKGGHHEFAVEASRSLAQAIGRSGDPGFLSSARSLKVLPWQRHGALCAEQERWEDAARAFTGAITLAPDDWGLRVQRGSAQGKLGRWTDAIADFTRAMELSPNAVWVRAERGKAHAMVGHWKEAANDFAALVRLDPSDVMDWLRAAPLLVLAGDHEAFRQHCKNMLDRFRENAELHVQEKTAKACLLTPDAVPITDIPLERLEAALDTQSVPAALSGWAWTTRALANCRRGDAKKALACVDEAEKTSTYEQNSRLRALALAVKALAQMELKQADEAKQTLAQATQMVKEDLSPIRDDAWPDLLIARIICEETAKRIQPANQD